MSTTFDDIMCKAAGARRQVVLADGRTGTLVYWPGRNAAQRTRTKPLRHGDPLRAGVMLDPEQPSRITAYHIHDIVGFVS